MGQRGEEVMRKATLTVVRRRIILIFSFGNGASNYWPRNYAEAMVWTQEFLRSGKLPTEAQRVRARKGWA